MWLFHLHSAVKNTAFLSSFPLVEIYGWGILLVIPLELRGKNIYRFMTQPNPKGCVTENADAFLKCQKDNQQGCVQFYGWWFCQWKSIDKRSFHVWWCGPLSFFVHYMKSSFEELLRDLQIISKELFLSSWNLVSTTNLSTANSKWIFEKSCAIENGWRFFPWNSKGITGKMP